NLIAQPGDDLFWSMAKKVSPGVNKMNSVRQALVEDYDVKVEDGLMTILPKDRLTAESEYISRSKLQGVLGRADGQGYGRLADRLDLLTLKESAPMREDLAMIYT